MSFVIITVSGKLFMSAVTRNATKKAAAEALLKPLLPLKLPPPGKGKGGKPKMLCPKIIKERKLAQKEHDKLAAKV